MIRYLIFLIGILICFVHHHGHAQKIRFYKNDLSNAIIKGKKKNKLIFVAAYADWCAPCKKMDKTIFTDKKVIQFFKKHFVNSKIDVESSVGDIFTENYPVSSIPCLFFFDGDQHLIYKKTGAPNNPKEFISIGQTALDIYQYKTTNTLISNPQSLFNYSYYLLESSDSNSSVFAKQYLSTQEDWNTVKNLNFILDFSESGDSLFLHYFLNHIDTFSKYLRAEQVSEKRTMLVLDQLLDFLSDYPEGNNPNFEKARPIFVKFFGQEQHNEHFLLFQFRYFQQQGDLIAMRKIMDVFVQEVVELMPKGPDQAKEYVNAANTYYHLAQKDKELEAKAFEWGQKAIISHPGQEIYTILSFLYEDAGFEKQAKKYQQKANELKIKAKKSKH